MFAVTSLAVDPTPRVFLSYAHDDDAHSAAVRELRELLTGLGFAVFFDGDVVGPVDWPVWQERSIDESDFVLVIASPQYRVRALGDGPSDVGRGVWAEARKLGAMIYGDKGTASLRKVLAVVLPGGRPDDLPWFFAPPASSYFAVPEISPSGVRPLLRVLRREVAVTAAGEGVRLLRRTITLDVSVRGRAVHTRLAVGGTPLGERRADLPLGIERAFSRLHGPPAEATAALREEGRRLSAALFDETTARRLAVVVDSAGMGEPVDVIVACEGDALVLPYEVLTLPDGRVLSTVAGVRILRRLKDVVGRPSATLPGPLRILAAVAAPARSSGPSLDVEREMQGIVDVVGDLGAAEVTILEVASLAEISAALHRDSYHVLHLSAHGSSATVELEDEDGNARPTTAADLVGALRQAGRPVPLIVLSSCDGAAGGDAGLAATLLHSGADRVLAMQAPVTDTYATRLMAELYRELAAANAPVAQALARARTVLYDPASTAVRPEYGVATLFAAAGDPPLCGPGEPMHLSRRVEPPTGARVRELRIGDLIGRRRELRTALAALRNDRRFVDAHGATRGVQLTGIGGIGKTALAGRIIARLKEDTANPWTVVVHEGVLNLQSLLDSCSRDIPGLGDALAQLDDAQQLPALLSLLDQARLLLVFDDFEQNLTPGGDAFRESATETLLHELGRAAGRSQSRILVTCRYPVPDEPDLYQVEVPPLSPAELRRMLLRMPMLRDASPDDRWLIVTTIGGHPRLIEFVDALLRAEQGRALRTDISEKLRDLARKAGISLARTPRQAPSLPEATRQSMAIGSRDILLDELLELLTARQREALLQAAVSRIPMTIADLGSALDPPGDIRVEANRLIDLTLLSTVDTGATDDIVVHTWVAEALTRHQLDQYLPRHERAFDMRLSRINMGRADFDDLSECVRHLGVLGRFEDMVQFTREASRLTGQAGAASLWALAGSLVPQSHDLYTVVLDMEIQARFAIGDRDVALTLARTAVEIDQALADAEPTSARLQRNLSISYERLGDVARAGGEAATAQELYARSLAIRLRLAQHEPDNIDLQRDLSSSYDRLGDLALAAGEVSSARELFRQGLEIARRLVQADRDNVDFQRDLSMSYNRLGDLAKEAGEADSARDLYQQGLEITQRLAEADPDNVDFQRDLSISYSRLGDLARAAGDLATARDLLQQDLEIALQLAEADPDDVGLQRDLSVSYDRVGALAVAAGDLVSGREFFEKGLEIDLRLVQANPGNVASQHDLSVSYRRLAELYAATDPAEGRRLLEAARAIVHRLNQIDPANATYRDDLRQYDAVLAQLGRA